MSEPDMTCTQMWVGSIVLGLLALGLAWVFLVAIQFGLAIGYGVRGRRARKIELAAWRSYYDRCGEKEKLEAEGKKTKERLQADLKLHLINQAAYVAACHAEDRRVEEFVRDVVTPAKRRADAASAIRIWFAERTVREWVMSES